MSKTKAIGLTMILLAGWIFVTSSNVIQLDLSTWTIPWVTAVSSPAPFVTTSPKVLVIYSDDPNDLKSLRDSHKEQAEMLSSTDKDSFRSWVTSHQGGEFQLLDKQSEKPSMNAQWMQDAYDAWKKKSSESGGSSRLPWIVAAGPNGGVNQPMPETKAETLKITKVIEAK